MAYAKFSIGTVNVTGYLRIIAREVSNLAAEAANELFPPPQPGVRNVQIDNLNPVPHRFEFYESADGIAVGVLLASYSIDVGLIMQAAFTRYEFKVDRGEQYDPVNGDSQYLNPALAGIPDNRLSVIQRVTGERSFELGEIANLPEGGFEFPTAERFVTDDYWVVYVMTLITTQSPVQIGRGIYNDIIEFEDDLDIDDTHADCLLEAAGPDSDILTLTFPLLNTIANDTVYGVTTHNGLQRYVAIQLQDGDVCRFMGKQKNVFWLGKSETILVIVKNGIMKVAYYQGDYAKVGHKVKTDIDLSDDDNPSPLNMLPEIGGWYNYADYPRLFYEFVNKLPPSQLSAVVGSAVTDRTKFAIDAPNSRFWLPDTGGYFERNVDPNADVDEGRDEENRYTGTVQQEGIGELELIIPGERVKLAGGGGNVTVLKQYGLPDAFVVGDDPINVTVSDAAQDLRPKNVAINSWRII